MPISCVSAKTGSTEKEKKLGLEQHLVEGLGRHVEPEYLAGIVTKVDTYFVEWYWTYALSHLAKLNATLESCKLGVHENSVGCLSASSITLLPGEA